MGNENLEGDDLSYLSLLNNLVKLELKDIKIPSLSFLRSLKKLAFFKTDTRAENESEVEVFGEMQNLKELIYPIGDMGHIKKCVKLRAIGVDAARFQALELLEGLAITDITIFNATSRENAESIVAELEKYCNVRSYGWQKTWN